MSPLIPVCRSCGAEIETVTQMQLAKVVVDKVVCASCMEAELLARQQQLF